MEKYTYKGLGKVGVIVLQLEGILVIIVSTLIVGTIYSILGRGSGSPEASSVGSLCAIMASLLFFWLIGLALLNMHPTIWTDDQGLIISTFPYRRIRIAWSDIIDIRQSFGLWGDYLVRARRITPFHIFYGVVYGFSGYPSFIIGKGIEDRDRLLTLIKSRVGGRPTP